MSSFAYRDPAPPEVPAGPLTGLAVAIPEHLSVRGWPAGSGSKALEGYVALEDATVVARLRQAGAVIVGSLPVGEFGLAPDSEAASRLLAEGTVEVVLMADLLGEARLAAARGGVMGFKPSAGILSRYGLIGLMPSLETLGLLARRPRAIAALLAAIAGPDERDPALQDGTMPDFSPSRTAGKPRRIGVVAEAVDALEGAERAAVKGGLDALEAAGMALSEIALPRLALFTLVHRIMGAVEASSSCGKFDGVRYGHRAAGVRNWNEMYLATRAAAFGVRLKGLLFQGAYLQFENYAAFEKAARVRARLAAETEALFAGVDALVLPTRRRENEGGSDGLAAFYAAGAFTLPANVLGLPALHLPGRNGAGGLQFLGPRLSDPGLLALAEGLSNEG